MSFTLGLRSPCKLSASLPWLLRSTRSFAHGHTQNQRLINQNKIMPCNSNISRTQSTSIFLVSKSIHAKLIHTGTNPKFSSKQSGLSVSPNKALRLIVNIIIAGTIYGLAGVILYWIYNKYYLKKRRADSIDEFLPEILQVKGNLSLVRYRGCVLSEDLIMSGTMEKVSNFEFRPEDVVVASFPKSGTTWLQEIVYQIFLAKDQIEEEKDSVMESIFPYLEFPYPGVDDITKRKGPRLIKTHLPCHLLPNSIGEAKPKVLYIYRNPKDVAVSYYHFAKMLNFVQFRGTFEKFLALFMRDRVPYAPYFSHLNHYLKLANDKPEEFLSLSYEDLKTSPRTQIQKVAKFLGFDLSDDEVEQITKNTTFEVMKDNPRTNYEHWDVFGIRNTEESKFMRQGKVGQNQNYFTEPYITSDFMNWINSGSSYMKINFTFDLDGSKDR